MTPDRDFSDSDPQWPAAAVAQAAADWVVRHDRGLTTDEALAFAVWQAADPRHGAEFSRISGAWQAMDRIGAVPSLAAMAEAAEVNARARRIRRQSWRRAGILAAAAAAVLIAGAISWRHWPRPAAPAAVAVEAEAGHYLVLASTAHRLALADGSVAELNGDSGVVADFVPAERRVKLVRGEAHFHVAKNPARPFIVSAGPITVQAVGTAFDVRLEAGAVEVLVTEGKVALGAATSLPEPGAAPIPTGGTLVAGDRAVVHLESGREISVTVDHPATREVDQTLAWENTRLVFDRTPLDQVVDAFNRFNTRQLVLSDSSLKVRTLTGTFRADNLTGFVRLLGASVDVEAQPGDDQRMVLRPVAPARP
jgi:transmembrane sensor